MVFGSHSNTRAMYSTPQSTSLAASMAAYRRRSFSDNHPKKRCIFSSLSAEYPSMIDSLSQNLSCYKDTTAQACREVIHDHILSAPIREFMQKLPSSIWLPLSLHSFEVKVSLRVRTRAISFQNLFSFSKIFYLKSLISF